MVVSLRRRYGASWEDPSCTHRARGNHIQHSPHDVVELAETRPVVPDDRPARPAHPHRIDRAVVTKLVGVTSIDEHDVDGEVELGGISPQLNYLLRPWPA